MVNHPVVYKSQWDPEAAISNNDCGASSAAMVMNFYGSGYTTDQVQSKTGAGGGLVTIAQMQTAITKCGYKSSYRVNLTLDDLKKLLDNKIIPIVLVHYGSLNSRQDKAFQAGHFMPIVGYYDGGVYANDPNFKAPLRADGDHHNYTTAEFMAAWGDCYKDKNPNFSALIIMPNTQTVSPVVYPINSGQITVTNPKGANVRTFPDDNENLQNVRTVAPVGYKFEADGYVLGSSVNGNNKWWKIKGQDLYLWTGITNFVPTDPKAAPTTPPVPDPVTPANTPGVAANMTIDQLVAENERLKGDNNNLIQDGVKKSTEISNLKKQVDELTRLLSEEQQKTINIETYKKVADQATKDIESLKFTNANLTTERNNAYIEAFKGWELIEVPADANAFRMWQEGYKIASLKPGLVIGYKVGAKLYKVGEETTGGSPAK